MYKKEQWVRLYKREQRARVKVPRMWYRTRERAIFSGRLGDWSLIHGDRRIVALRHRDTIAMGR